MAVVEAWETLKQAVETYTGLSPVSFFTVLALAAAIYYTVAGFFETQPTAPQAHAHEVVEREPLRPPVQLGEITEEELRAYNGSDREKPLLMAIKSQIYDVSQSRMFYGPGGPYSLFAGKDASRALAKMTFEPEDLTGDLSGLGPFELEALQDWENKFMSKYVKVGTVTKIVPVTVTEGSDAGASNVSDASASNVTEAVAPAIATENKDSPADDAAAGLDALSEHKAVKANEN